MNKHNPEYARKVIESYPNHNFVFDTCCSISALHEQVRDLNRGSRIKTTVGNYGTGTQHTPMVETQTLMEGGKLF